MTVRASSPSHRNRCGWIDIVSHRVGSRFVTTVRVLVRADGLGFEVEVGIFYAPEQQQAFLDTFLAHLADGRSFNPDRFGSGGRKACHNQAEYQ